MDSDGLDEWIGNRGVHRSEVPMSQEELLKKQETGVYGNRTHSEFPEENRSFSRRRRKIRRTEYSY